MDEVKIEAVGTGRDSLIDRTIKHISKPLGSPSIVTADTLLPSDWELAHVCYC
jgi:hypothetical protein